VVADKLLATVAKTVCDVGDVRFGFRVLLSAALLAEKGRRQTIEAGDVASAAEEENRVRKLRDLETLRDKLLKLKKKYEKD
jgi:Cdc6-like AAA superfamily ATPase